VPWSTIARLGCAGLRGEGLERDKRAQLSKFSVNRTAQNQVAYFSLSNTRKTDWRRVLNTKPGRQKMGVSAGGCWGTCKPGIPEASAHSGRQRRAARVTEALEEAIGDRVEQHFLSSEAAAGRSDKRLWGAAQTPTVTRERVDVHRHVGERHVAQYSPPPRRRPPPSPGCCSCCYQSRP